MLFFSHLAYHACAMHHVNSVVWSATGRNLFDHDERHHFELLAKARNVSILDVVKNQDNHGSLSMSEAPALNS